MAPTKLLALLLAFFALYGALLYAGLGLGAAIPVETAVYKSATAAMGWLASEPVERRVQLAQEGGEVVYTLQVAIGNELREGRFRHTFHAQNLLLFLALALATPGIALRARLGSMALGLAAIFLLDIAITMGDVWVAEGTKLDLDTRQGANRGLAELGLLLRFLHPTGGAFMAPVFVWGLLLLGPFRAGVMRALARSNPEHRAP